MCCDEYQQNQYIDEMTVEELELHCKNVDLIQPACDTEFLLHPNWRELLTRISNLGVNVSFATKLNIADDDLLFLSEINNKLMANGSILNIGVTIIKLEQHMELEPLAPTPKQRMKTLEKLHSNGIPCNVILRPIFPTLTLDEINNLIFLTKEFSDGYLIGPLYINQSTNEYLQKHNIVVVPQTKFPMWNQGKEMKVLYCNEIMVKIAEVAANHDKQVFFSNRQCVDYLIHKFRRTGL